MNKGKKILRDDKQTGNLIVLRDKKQTYNARIKEKCRLERNLLREHKQKNTLPKEFKQKHYADNLGIFYQKLPKDLQERVRRILNLFELKWNWENIQKKSPTFYGYHKDDLDNVPKLIIQGCNKKNQLKSFINQGLVKYYYNVHHNHIRCFPSGVQDCLKSFKFPLLIYITAEVPNITQIRMDAARVKLFVNEENTIEPYHRWTGSNHFEKDYEELKEANFQKLQGEMNALNMLTDITGIQIGRWTVTWREKDEKLPEEIKDQIYILNTESKEKKEQFLNIRRAKAKHS
ncbi:uncharacterized protein LOC109851246 [Asparagus officinalis]|uniref:uncharacterized protein LOC109851246 n=1 Tax=Asparagus officinalis TaxID=4686 RepID=UPI00098E2531|nr:uncharacterized protein LOC109851246 [Asparagus officinalis]